MKYAFLVIPILIASIRCGAQVLQEEIEFVYEPVFVNGTLVRFTRIPEGKIECSVYSTEFRADSGAKSGPERILVLNRRGYVSVGDFEKLAREVESKNLNREAESRSAAGVDGESWRFRHIIKGRTLELRFWCPELRKGSLAYSLATKFFAVAAVVGVLPHESSDPNGDIPKVVTVEEFKRPSAP